MLILQNKINLLSVTKIFRIKKYILVVFFFFRIWYNKCLRLSNRKLTNAYVSLFALYEWLLHRDFARQTLWPYRQQFISRSKFIKNPINKVVNFPWRKIYKKTTIIEQSPNARIIEVDMLFSITCKYNN